MAAGLTLGAPGVYAAPVPVPDAGLAPIRLDATGFVGVAFRGPVDCPVAVTSWSQFVERFGADTDPEGHPCPGLLPLAVRAFFAQGGTTAWVNRIGPVRPDPTATALYRLLGRDAQLTAANEGTWGGRLAMTLRFDGSGSFRPPSVSDPGAVTAGELAVPDGLSLPRGSLLRLGGTSDDPLGTLHWVTAVVVRPLRSGGLLRVAQLDPHAPAGSGTRTATVLTGTLLVTDTDPTIPRAEVITGLGLHPAHPRYPTAVLRAESELVRTAAGWTEALLPDAALTDVPAVAVRGGRDRFAEIDRNSLFDVGGADSDPLDERNDHRGVDRIGRVDDIGLLCVPDLPWAWQDPPSAPPESQKPAATDRFRPCAPDPDPVVYAATTTPLTHLDAQEPTQLAEIVDRQRRLVDVAVLRHRFVALLDAPSRLALADLSTWRSQFDSSYVAGYHPWLGVTDPAGGPARPVPPSAFAAGIIADRERRLGLAWGPANQIAVSAVTTVDEVTDAVHDALHRMGVNVFRAERDGFRLSAARTLTTDPGYRQLSVRRLMTMIALTVERQSQWLVFEPNTPNLRSTVQHVLTRFLADLFRAGAFAGATEEESFFVRCDDTLNPTSLQGLGRLIAEIGVAPASPLEYLVLRLTQDVDGGAQVVGA